MKKLFVTLSAVPLSLARPYLKNFKRHYPEIFNKYGEGRRKDRIYWKVGAASAAAPIEIEKYLNELGYSIENYVLGLASKNNRVIKIGKLLKEEPELSAKFNHDKARGSARVENAKKLLCVISRHPYDIIGASFDRGWSSCMNLEDGSNNQFLEKDVEAGTLVAYLVENSDKNINKPVARVLLKPFHSRRDMMLVADKTYGTAPPTFRKAIDSFLEKFNEGKEGFFTLYPELYNDGTSYVIKGNGEVEDYVEELVDYFNEADEEARDHIESELIAIARNTKSEKAMRVLAGTDNYNVCSELMENIHATRDIFKRLRDSELFVDEPFIAACPFFDLVKVFNMDDVVDNFTGTIDNFDDAVLWLKHNGESDVIDDDIAADLLQFAVNNIDDEDEEELIASIIQLDSLDIPVGRLKARDIATLIVKKDCAQILSNFESETVGEVLDILDNLRDSSIGSYEEEEFISNNIIEDIKLTDQTVAGYLTDLLRLPVKNAVIKIIADKMKPEILELVRSSSLKVSTLFSDKSHYFNGSFFADTGSLSSPLGLPKTETDIENFVSGFSSHRITANILSLPANLVDKIIQHYSLERIANELLVKIAGILKDADFELSRKGKKIVENFKDTE